MKQSRLSVLVVLAIALAMPTTAMVRHAAGGQHGHRRPHGRRSHCLPIDRQAVANAVSGDTILVGPGIYSTDLDRDGVPDEPGEEPSSMSIDKAVKVLSAFGASSTVIERVDRRHRSEQRRVRQAQRRLHHCHHRQPAAHSRPDPVPGQRQGGGERHRGRRPYRRSRSHHLSGRRPVREQPRRLAAGDARADSSSSTSPRRRS